MKYDERKAVRTLSTNPAITIDLNTIEVLKGATTVGNKSWGKIDFLTKHCGYVLVFVDLDAVKAKKLEEKAAKEAAKRAERAERNKSNINLVGSVKTHLHKVKLNK